MPPQLDDYSIPESIPTVSTSCVTDEDMLLYLADQYGRPRHATTTQHYPRVSVFEGKDRRVVAKHGTTDIESDRFCVEARSLLELRHSAYYRRVIEMVLGSEGLVRALVLEYVPGRSVQEHLVTDFFDDLVHVAMVMRDQFLALQHAHDHQIVLRDVASGNLIVDSAYGMAHRAIQIDLGVSMNWGQEVPRGAKVQGRHYYASAHFAKGEPADPKDDLFAAGILLGQMLKWPHPYGVNPATKYLAADLVPQLEWSPIYVNDRDTPDVFNRLHRGLTSRDPDERAVAASSAVPRLQQFIDENQDA